MDIRTITTTAEKIRLYRFRKKVFVDEEQRFKADSDQISDLYDSLEETVNLAAFHQDEMVAALRVTLDGAAGLPVDRHWDFKGFRAGLDALAAGFGWLCCTRKFRHKSGLIRSLVAEGARQAGQNGADHILGVIHPPIFDLLHHCFGVKQIGSPFLDPHLGVDMIPIHGRVAEVLRRHAARDCHLPDDAGAPDLAGPDLTAMGILGHYHFLEQALSRNIGILTPGEQERLIRSRIAIPGLGGVGGQHLVTLARSGIGKFTLADFDTFEAPNINRQYGARISGLGRPKTDVMAKEALDINPWLDIRTFPEGVTPDNIDRFLEGVDLVADGMDFFNIEIRRLIFNRARERQIPVVTAGPLGFSTALLVFMPDRGMGFDDYFDLRPGMDRETRLLRFLVGLAPKASQAAYMDPAAVSMGQESGPSTGAACQICSGVLATEALRILLKKQGIRPAPRYFQYDPFTRKFIRGWLPMGNRNPIQKVKLFMVRQMLSRALPQPLPPAPACGRIEKGPVPDAVLDYLIRAGGQAPSGDNCQPWTFAADGQGITVRLAPGADPSFFNVNQAASRLACGAAAENIVLAATRFGLSSSVVCQADRARIALTPSGVAESPLQRFIWTRHTNRTPYSCLPLPDQAREALHKSIEDVPGTRLILVREKQALATLARIIREADLIRFQRRDLHTHFMAMVRFTREAALDSRTGLPLKNLEAGPAGDIFLRTCRPWPMMRAASLIGLDRVAAGMAAKGLRECAAAGLLVCKDFTPDRQILAGRALERLWLTTAREGLSFQPMTAITLFRLRWDWGLKEHFSMAHQQRLGQLWPLYDDLFRTEAGEMPVMLFRLGYGSPAACRTLRRIPDLAGRGIVSQDLTRRDNAG